MPSVLVLEHDPDLAGALTPGAFREAQPHSIAPRLTADPGAWSADLEPRPPSGTLGLLVLSGLLERDLSVRRASAVEFLGPGDVIRPWTWSNGESRSIPAEARWEVLERTTLALLDREFALRMARWPEVAACVVERATERARSLAIQLAIRQHTVDERVMMMLWHLADRWGRVRPDGTVLRIPHLTHAQIGRVVGASRPTVSSIVTRLRDDGRMERSPEGYWVLHGEPPREVVRTGSELPGRTLALSDPSSP